MCVTAFVEVFRMQEPKILQYQRPLLREDRQEIGEVNFAEYGYTMGVLLRFYDPETRDSYAPLPKEVGTLAAELVTTYGDEYEDYEDIALVDCREIIAEEAILRSSDKV